MARLVLFRPQAEREVVEAGRWYEERRTGLGAEFSAALRDTVSRVAENPLAFPRVHEETRRAMLRHFPYAIYFRTLSDTVVVLAVHGRQDPQRWQTRR